MIDDRTIELINKELDSLNSETESKELETLLSENDEALKYYDELLRAASVLKRIQEVEPPSFLKTQILNSIKSLPVPKKVGFLDGIFTIFRQRPVARYAVVFACGLCVGILLLVVADPWHQDEIPDTAKVSGTMIVPADVSHLPKIDSVTVDGSGFRGMFKTLRGDGTITVECAVASTENLRLEMSADQEELKFVAINRLGGTDNDVMATGGRVIFTGTKSEHGLITYTELAAPRQPIEVRMYKGGAVVGTVSIRTN
jgi:hypothetical protein